MGKRKKDWLQDAPNLKRFRSEIQSMTNSQHHFNRPAPKQTRKQKRREARLEKKSRRNAYCRKQPIPSKDEIEKAQEEAAKKQQIENNKKKLEDKKQRKKAKKKRQKQQELEARNEKRKIEEIRDDKEIKDLEKKLGLNKRKKKDTLPLSFKNDGLDYILDVLDSEKIQGMMNLGEDFDEDGDNIIGNEDRYENDSDVDEDIDDDIDENDDDFDDDDGDEEESDVDNSQEGKQDKSISDVNAQDLAAASDKKTKEDESNTEKQEKGKEKWEELAERIKLIAEKKQRKKRSVRFAEEEDVKIISSDNQDSESGEGEDNEERESDEGEDSEGELEDSVGDINAFLDDFEGGEIESDGDFDEDELGNNQVAGIDEEDSDAGSDGEDNDNIDDTNMEDDPENVENSDLKEDIYGRLRDAQGNIIKDNKPAGGEGAYVPPARRLQMAGSVDEKKKIMLERLLKQLKGLVNRASENNMQPISAEIENLYLSNSRADINDTLVNLIAEACISPVLTPERLTMELMMLVAILHGNVGSEVGAAFLQHFVKRYHTLLKEPEYGQGKLMDNVVVLIAHLYNFKVVHSVLVFDILKMFTATFKEKDVELILLLLRHVGFSLRKDNPSELKDFIVTVQTRAGGPDATSLADQSRVRFMLEVILAIRNNNMRKIPNYDPEHLDHLKKIIRSYIRGGQFGDNQLHVTLEDLMNAEEKGKWWLVGSAWDGKSPQQQKTGVHNANSVLGELVVSSKLQQLARKQRMNTDLRRNLFYLIMTSEDYLDAFEKLLRLGLKSSQKQEIILVIMDCCLQEKKYNPFYAYLGQKFCEYHRTYQMAFQFCIWDRFKEIGSLSDTNRHNLAKLLNHLIINGAQSLSMFKMISFGTLEKGMVRLLKILLSELLLDHSQSDVEAAFTRISQIDKLRQLTEGLRLFFRHFLVGKKRDSKDPKLVERVEIVDRILAKSKSQVLL